MQFRHGIILLAASAFVLASCSAAEINVFAAASLADVLKKLGNDYEREGSDKVLFNFAASSFLARQIEQGAPADVFFSADDEKMNILTVKGLVAAETRKVLLGNTLVLVISSKRGLDIRSPRDLVRPEVKRVTLAETTTVPAGIYARRYLTRLGLWDKLEAKVVPTENVRAAVSAVAAGNADAAMVYQTDAAISTKVKVVYNVPASETPDINYPVAAITKSKHPAAARDFIAYLQTPHAAKVFREAGFLLRAENPR